MKVLNRAVIILLAAIILYPFNCAFAEEPVPEKAPLIEPETLDGILEKTLTDLNVDCGTVSVALLYTGSGEKYYFNADCWMYSASLYKLPVCMTYSHMIETGELPANSLSCTDDYVFSKILGISSNTWASRLKLFLYGNEDCIREMREQDLKYSHFDEVLLPENYYRSSNYSARFYLGIIEELFNNCEEYPDILDYMNGASPTKYFCRNLGEKYQVAQKYGSALGSVHAAGIIYTDAPILLVIMTDNKSDAVGNKIIGTLSEIIVEYVSERSITGE